MPLVMIRKSWKFIRVDMLVFYTSILMSAFFEFSNRKPLKSIWESFRQKLSSFIHMDFSGRLFKVFNELPKIERVFIIEWLIATVTEQTESVPSKKAEQKPFMIRKNLSK